MPAGQGWGESELGSDGHHFVGVGFPCFSVLSLGVQSSLQILPASNFYRLVNNCDIWELPFLNVLPESLCVCFGRSEEKIKHFSQLKSELFLQDNTLRKILSLITELRIAAKRNFILKRLFWKVSILFLIFKTCFIWLSNLSANQSRNASCILMLYFKNVDYI